MGGGLIQLVGYGYENIYLTHNAQITFFKVVYRRHTNFSVEQIPQYFTGKPNFGKISSCHISRRADLIGQIYLAVSLPRIRKSADPNVQFAWVKRVGFSLLKSIEIEINGKVIDTHYGEWLSIWAELTGQLHGNKAKGYNKMIGDVPELTDFSSSKDEYMLYIPFQFWFCRDAGLTLPLISLQYCDIKINVEFQDAEKCYIISPTHYIQCRDDIVNFIPHEYIEQNINGKINAGIFVDYDITQKRLYYCKITDSKFESVPISSTFDTSSVNQAGIDSLLGSSFGLQYSIVGKTSNYSTFAEFNNNSITYPSTKIRNLNFADCFLLIDYYYLEEEERFKFVESKHDYLIEQLHYTPNTNIDSIYASPPVIASHPTKLLVWVAQLKYLNKFGDYYNYTNSYQYKKFKNDLSNYPDGFPMGKSMIDTQTIIFNGNKRLSERKYEYFDLIQKYQYTNASCFQGINMYSFCAHPFKLQPSGSCNMSQINNLQMQLKMIPSIHINNNVLFRAYALSYQILRMSNGLTGVVFT